MNPTVYCPFCASDDTSRMVAGINHWLLHCHGCDSEWVLTDEEMART